MYGHGPLLMGIFITAIQAIKRSDEDYMLTNLYVKLYFILLKNNKWAWQNMETSHAWDNA